MENEIMNNEEMMDMNEIEVIDEEKNRSLAIPALIIAGVAAAGFGAYKLGKKMWEKYKAKKAENNGDSDVEVIEVGKTDVKRVK